MLVCIPIFQTSEFFASTNYNHFTISSRLRPDRTGKHVDPEVLAPNANLCETVTMNVKMSIYDLSILETDFHF